ncbi:hypothetical protein ABIF23_005830 [Bradyrhizobium elkanii]|uniref:MFS transporter n=1 Tax=Bradyrhizobium elkanii TaxID=29448 RepID=UPI0035121FDC
MSKTLSGAEDYTARQRYSIMISAMLGYILDFYDVLIFPFLLPAIQRSMSLSLTEIGSLQALTLFGSAIGGALFGVIGDRLGRKTSLQLAIALFSVAAIISAFAWNYWSLAVLRFITGIGLGGEYGVGMVLFNEAWKNGSRGLGAAALQGCAVIASSTASIVGIWLIATFSDEWSWRIGLLSGGVPILLIIFIRFFMPESKIWLEYEAQRKAGPVVAAARTLPLADLFRNGLARQTVTAFVWLMSYMLCYYSVVSFIPTLLLRDMHTPGDVVRTTARSSFRGQRHLLPRQRLFQRQGWPPVRCSRAGIVLGRIPGWHGGVGKSALRRLEGRVADVLALYRFRYWQRCARRDGRLDLGALSGQPARDGGVYILYGRSRPWQHRAGYRAPCGHSFRRKPAERHGCRGPSRCSCLRSCLSSAS